MARPRRPVIIGAAAAIGATVAAAIASPLVSPYQLVVSPRTYALGLALGVAAVVPRRIPWSTAVRRRIAFGVVALAGATFFGSALIQRLHDYGGNYSSFLHMPAETAERAPFLRERPDLVRRLALRDESYDAQFMYLMAFDPFMRRFADEPARYREVVDFPPYRYGRIGYSWLTAAAAFGKPERFPAVMMWWIVVGHLILGVALALLAHHYGASPWLAPMYLLIPGYMASFQFGLPEALASAGLVAGVYLWLQNRHAAAVTAFAASLLIRETGLLMVVMAVAGLGSGSWKVRTGWLTCAVLPLMLWRLYVAATLWADFGLVALAPNPDIMDLPISGLGELVRAASTGTHPSSEVRGALAMPVLLLLGTAIVSWHWKAAPAALTVACLGYAVMALSLDYEHVWQHVPSGERATTEFFLGVLLVTIATRNRVRPLAWFWVATGVYTFFLSPEAAFSRAALGIVH